MNATDSRSFGGRSLKDASLALTSEKPLSSKRCIQVSAVIAALALFSGALAFVVGLKTGSFPSASFARLLTIQSIVAALVLIGALRSWFSDHFARRYLFTTGVLLSGLLLWYPIFMSWALTHRAECGAGRIAHSPGVLAFGLSYAVRLMIDFGAPDEIRRKWARRSGIAGMIIGGFLDVFVVSFMVFTFKHPMNN